MRRLRTAAVKVMAGTDLAVLNLYPGVSLHEELAFLVDSLSLTPLEAIQAATVEPARSFRISNTIGTIEPGRAADLRVGDCGRGDRRGVDGAASGGGDAVLRFHHLRVRSDSQLRRQIPLSLECAGSGPRPSR